MLREKRGMIYGHKLSPKVVLDISSDFGCCVRDVEHEFEFS
ncbi:hypothetical protein VIBNIFTn2_120177 [Vibrio nigripulchritudo FTn2]|nr:hypothetical protein VIBNIFTn2_120177 [Vibrio nigripulchritudo FTn2]